MSDPLLDLLGACCCDHEEDTPAQQLGRVAQQRRSGTPQPAPFVPRRHALLRAGPADERYSHLITTWTGFDGGTTFAQYFRTRVTLSAHGRERLLTEWDEEYQRRQSADRPHYIVGLSVPHGGERVLILTAPYVIPEDTTGRHLDPDGDVTGWVVSIPHGLIKGTFSFPAELMIPSGAASGYATAAQNVLTENHRGVYFPHTRLMEGGVQDDFGNDRVEIANVSVTLSGASVTGYEPVPLHGLIGTGYHRVSSLAGYWADGTGSALAVFSGERIVSMEPYETVPSRSALAWGAGGVTVIDPVDHTPPPEDTAAFEVQGHDPRIWLDRAPSYLQGGSVLRLANVPAYPVTPSGSEISTVGLRAWDPMTGTAGAAVNATSRWDSWEGTLTGVPQQAIPNASGRLGYSVVVPTDRAIRAVTVTSVTRDGPEVRLALSGPRAYADDTLTLAGQALPILAGNDDVLILESTALTRGITPGTTLDLKPGARRHRGAVPLSDDRWTLSFGYASNEPILFTSSQDVTLMELHPTGVSVTGGTLTGSAARLNRPYLASRSDLLAGRVTWVIPSGTHALTLAYTAPEELPPSLRAWSVASFAAGVIPSGSVLMWAAPDGDDVEFTLRSGEARQVPAAPADGFGWFQASELPTSFTLRVTIPPGRVGRVRLSQASLLLGFPTEAP